jgi:AraC family transcriptional regulator of adaptative response / DNA-3-methyladenine glycosylase II
LLSQNGEPAWGRAIILAAMPHSLPAAAICQRARESRDARFDGLFVVGVLTTGIFCRPACPARIARAEHHRFFADAAAARAAGFRACLRCRPEDPLRAPLHRDGVVGDAVVHAVLDLLAGGAAGTEVLAGAAERTGVGRRQLVRRFARATGRTPGAVLRAHRTDVAHRLVTAGTLPLTEVAAAAGFGSVRRFNAAFVAAFGQPPSVLRAAARAPAGPAAAPRPATRARAAATAVPPEAGAGAPVDLCVRLPWRGDYDVDGMLGWLGARALPGIESVAAASFLRRLGPGELHIQFPPAAASRTAGVRVVLAGVAATAVGPLLARVHHLLDLAANSAIIDAHLRADPLLDGCVARAPGLRVPGCLSGFELAVRAVLGQQVSVAAATTLAARLVQHAGAIRGDDARSFPGPAELAGGNLAGIDLPRRRAAAIGELARRVLAGHLDLEAGEAPRVVRELEAVPGIGAWTAQYVAMRACHDPDAFPAHDAVLRRVTGGLSPRALLARAERWRPWRAYAAMHLWRQAAAAGAPGAGERTRHGRSAGRIRREVETDPVASEGRWGSTGAEEPQRAESCVRIPGAGRTRDAVGGARSSAPARNRRILNR